MKPINILFALLLSACGVGTATQKDETKPAPSPETVNFQETEAKPLLVTPYMTQWKINELYADVTGFPGVVGTFTYSADREVELKLGYRGVEVTECSKAGGAEPSFVVVRKDGSRQGIALEDAFVVAAGETIGLKVSMANPADCHGIDVTFGINFRER